MLNTFRSPPLLATATAVRPTTTLDLDALGTYLRACRACQGRWVVLTCAGKAVQGFLAPRVITTLVLALALWTAVGALA